MEDLQIRISQCKTATYTQEPIDLDFLLRQTMMWKQNTYYTLESIVQDVGTVHHTQ